MDYYKCLACKQTATIEDDSEPPECCGETMKKVSRKICLQPAHPEHARPMQDDEPCDDFRGGE